MRYGNDIWFEAILKNDVEWVKNWIKETNNIDITDCEKCTPLSWSCFLNRKEITHLLLENGANPFIQDSNKMFPWYISMSRNNDDGWERWHKEYAIFKNLQNTYYIIDLLANIITPLMKTNNWKAIETIFDYKDPNIINGVYYYKEGSFSSVFIPLSHLAYSFNKKELIMLLLKYDYNIDNTDNDNNTVLDIVLCDKNNEWKDFLFSVGAKKYKKELK